MAGFATEGSRLRGRLFFVLMLALTLGPGCSKAPAEPATTGAQPAGADAPSNAEADRAIVELLAAARKRLGADRAVVNNRLGYVQAADKHERQRQGTGMAGHLPRTPIDRQALAKALGDAALEMGLLVVKVDVGPATVAAPVPETWEGQGPYSFTPEQLFVSHPVAITLGTVSRTALLKFYGELTHEALPLVDVTQVQRSASEVKLVGKVYREAAVTPPRKPFKPLTMEALASSAKVTIPKEHPRLVEVGALIREHGQLAAEVESAVAELMKANLAGARFKFYRKLTERLAANPLPEGQ